MSQGIWKYQRYGAEPRCRSAPEVTGQAKASESTDQRERVTDDASTTSSERKSMEMHELKSSNISSIGYDKDTKDLRVNFVRGGRYVLHDVEPALFDQFLKAESPGAFYAKHLRGLYHFERLGDEE